MGEDSGEVLSMSPQLPAPPAWLKACALSSMLNARDVRALLHASAAQFERMLKMGRFPQADYKRGSKYSRGAIRYWTVRSVLSALDEAQRAPS